MSKPRKAQLQAAIERQVASAKAARHVTPTSSSWWLSATSRTEFYEYQRAEQNRMSASRYGQNYEPPKHQE